MTLGRIKGALLVIGGLALGALPYWAGDLYQLHLAQLIGVYWILIAGLNLVVGYSGQLSVGHVGLLAVGAYGFAIASGVHALPPFVGVIAAGLLGGVCGFLLGLPSLRL